MYWNPRGITLKEEHLKEKLAGMGRFTLVFLSRKLTKLRASLTPNGVGMQGLSSNPRWGSNMPRVASVR